MTQNPHHFLCSASPCPAAVNQVLMTQDGQTVVTLSKDCTARVWDAATGDCRHVLTGVSGQATLGHFGCSVFSLMRPGAPADVLTGVPRYNITLPTAKRLAATPAPGMPPVSGCTCWCSPRLLRSAMPTVHPRCRPHRTACWAAADPLCQFDQLSCSFSDCLPPSRPHRQRAGRLHRGRSPPAGHLWL